MKTPKRDRYRKLLEAVFKEIRYNSNWTRASLDGHTDLICGNRMRLRDLMKKFEEIKSER